MYCIIQLEVAEVYSAGKLQKEFRKNGWKPFVHDQRRTKSKDWLDRKTDRLVKLYCVNGKVGRIWLYVLDSKTSSEFEWHSSVGWLFSTLKCEVVGAVYQYLIPVPVAQIEMSLSKLGQTGLTITHDAEGVEYANSKWNLHFHPVEQAGEHFTAVTITLGIEIVESVSSAFELAQNETSLELLKNRLPAFERYSPPEYRAAFRLIEADEKSMENN